MPTPIEAFAKLEARTVHGADPVLRSAYEACLVALKQPGTHVRITAKNIEQTNDLIEVLSQLLTSKGVDALRGTPEKRDFLSNGEYGPILELKNGSGIEIAKVVTHASP